MSEVKFFENEYGLPGIEGDEIKVEFVDLGEGCEGYFDSNDPEDVHLLRFDAFRKDENGDWNGDDGSYCTIIPYDTDKENLKKLLQVIFNGITFSQFKKTCEQMSWASPEWLEEK